MHVLLLQATAYVQIVNVCMRHGSVEVYRIEAVVIRGYHVYKSIWLNPVMEEELSCEREIGNAQDTVVSRCQTNARLKTLTLWAYARPSMYGEVKPVGHITPPYFFNMPVQFL